MARKGAARGRRSGIWGSAVSTTPSGTYTGNETDEIILPAEGTRDDIRKDTTLADRGVPYRIGGPTGGKTSTVGQEGAAPLLTIEPGVTLRFDKEVRLVIDATAAGVALGALKAEGTAEKPITFTSASATPAAGDWVGIVFEGTPDARSKIAHAKVAFAGGPRWRRRNHRRRRTPPLLPGQVAWTSGGS